ncbi:MAG: HIRAN domain-containing protein [Desulfobacteraceae bacterium]|nr:HIRAN domain-containing protein [Desulfobacteraceae bacterium]
MPTTRRNFFKIIAGLPLTAAFASPALAAPPPQAPPARLLLNRFSIAGFPYYDGPASVRRLRPSAQCKLTREPQNSHDPFAVEIHLGRSKLGYVPRSDNKHLSRLLEQGARLVCRVVEVDPGGGGWHRVGVEVWIG